MAKDIPIPEPEMSSNSVPLPNKPSEDTKKTLYCSFCGKSQHEVRKLIAGPTAFICDECIELCDEIIVEQDGHDGEHHIRIISSVLADADFELALASAYSEILTARFPGLKVNVQSCRRGSSGMTFDLFVRNDEVVDERLKNVETLKDEIIKLSFQLNKAKALVNSNKEEMSKMKAKIGELNAVVADIYLNKLKEIRAREDKYLVICNLDIVGFSKMSEEERVRIVDIFRMHISNITTRRGGLYFNTAGDSFICAFEDAAAGIKTILLVMVFLDLEGVRARAGVTYGKVSVGYNEVIERTDIGGDVVNLSERLQSAAQPGEVLGDIEVLHELDPSWDEVQRVRTHRMLKKSAGVKTAGESVECVVFKLKRNAPISLSKN